HRQPHGHHQVGPEPHRRSHMVRERPLEIQGPLPRLDTTVRDRGNAGTDLHRIQLPPQLMDLDRIYAYRFRDVDHGKRAMVWKELAAFLHEKLGRPMTILDPAAGMCEYINAAPSTEKWAVDLNEPFIRAHANKDLRIVIGDTRTADLPKDHFDAVFVSNLDRK